MFTFVDVESADEAQAIHAALADPPTRAALVLAGQVILQRPPAAPDPPAPVARGEDRVGVR